MATKNEKESMTAESSTKERTLGFGLYTLWLFTYSDLKTILIPQTIFGIVAALSGPLLTTNSSPSILEILSRLPYILIWAWINLLMFVLDNQRQSESIREDSINKPWRPIPSLRIGPETAQKLLLIVIPCVLLIAYCLGGTTESLVLISLTWMYNDLGGANQNFAVRNLLNAFGFLCWSSGTTIVATGYGRYEMNKQSVAWLAIVGLVVFSTITIQDMADMEGDKARGRGTLPLVYGESVARISIALPVVFWSVWCPYYWGVVVWLYLPSLILGGVIAVRVSLIRHKAADTLTLQMWCFWTMLLYTLPALKFGMSY